MTMWDAFHAAQESGDVSARIAVQRIMCSRDKGAADFFIVDAGYQRALQHEIYATINDLRPAVAERTRERRIRTSEQYGWTFCSHDDGHGFECGIRLDNKDDGRCPIHGIEQSPVPK